MFLNLDNKNKNILIWVIIHLVLGVISSETKYMLIVWFYGAALWFIYKVASSDKERQKYLSYMIFYLGAFDVISRMAKSSPFIPYELSKYMLIPLFIYGLIISFRSFNMGYVMVLLVIPAFFYDFSDNVVFNDIINNGFGPLVLSLSIAYFYYRPLTIEMIITCLRLMLFPSLMVLAFAFIKTPDYDEIEFGYAANFQTSGGFGSNQVSNALGVGAFIIFIHLMYNKKLTGFRVFDLGLLGVFMLQALLTFSRGGMLMPIVGALTFIAFLPRGDNKEAGVIKVNKTLVFIYFIASGILGFGLYTYVDNLSGNILSLRFRGETVGTLAGSKEVSVATFTSNRSDLLLSELEMWLDNPVTGVGIGASAHLRREYTDIDASSHTEFSRVLAEHGIAGMIYLLLWISIVYRINKINKGVNKALLISLFVIAFFTSTHSSMRVYITPLVTGLSVCLIQMAKSNKRIPLLRKSIKKPIVAV